MEQDSRRLNESNLRISLLRHELGASPLARGFLPAAGLGMAPNFSGGLPLISHDQPCALWPLPDLLMQVRDASCCASYWVAVVTPRVAAKGLEVEVTVQAAWPAASLAAELLEGLAELGRGAKHTQLLFARGLGFS